MASKRKRALPPWLQGVEVKNKRQLAKSCDQSTDKSEATDTSTKSTASNKNENQKTTDSIKPKPQINTQREEICANQKDQKEWDLDTAVAMSYPEYQFEGSIIYSHTSADTNILCEDIIANMKENTDTVVGFDTEWPVTYDKGKQAKTALVQVCASESKCYLFHIACMPKFPAVLKKLLEMETLKKVGLNVEYDIWKLGTDFDIRSKDIVQKSLIELKTLANRKLKSSENWSLEGLARNVLRIRISKDPAVRKCDWRQFPLPDVQQVYAATDAAVSLLIYNKLTSENFRR